MSMSVGIEDLRRSFRFLPLSTQLAVSEVRARYVRSLLGPLWITASMVGMSAAIGFVMTGLFGVPLRLVLPFVMVGITLWGFISQSAIEACTALLTSRAHLLGSPLPYASFANTVIIRNLILLMHHFSAYVVLALALKIWPQPGWLLAIPGMAIVLVAVVGLVLFLCSLAPRFRDLVPLVTLASGVGALLTPVYWRPDLLVKNHFIAQWNPFTHLLAVVRQPLINEATTPENWIVAVLFSLTLAAVGSGAFIVVRKRLPFWI